MARLSFAVSYLHLAVILSVLLIFSIISNISLSVSHQSASATIGQSDSTVDTSENSQRHVPGRLLIKFKENLANDTIRQHQIIWQNGAQLIDDIPRIGVKILKVPEEAIDKVQAAFERNENVEYVEKDLLFKPESVETTTSVTPIIPNDPLFGNQWHLSKIGAANAWNMSLGTNVIVAILDSGVEPSHPDLVDKLLPGYNFYDNNNNTTDIGCKHGTVVAGIAAGSTNNGIGVASIAWNSKILPLRVTDADCWGSISAMSKAIVYASDNGARIANISFKIANPSSSSSLADAYKYMYGRGGFVVIAAGNDGLYLDYPDTPEVIHVGSTESRDYITNFSNYGPFVDFVAPGQAIYTEIWNGQYNYVSGTSFSAPVISGVLALMFAANPSATPQQVYDALKQSASDIVSRDDGYSIVSIPSGPDYYSGWGRIDAYKAVQKIVGLAVSTQDMTPPVVNTQSSITMEANSAIGSVVNYASATATDNVGVVSGPTCLPASGSIFPLGSTAVLCTATDAAGNTGSAAFMVSVLDTLPPNLKVPSDMPVTVTTGSTGISVSYVVSASDLVDGPVIPTCSPASGAIFPIGDTLVLCTAIDSHGNRGSATFHVKVTASATSTDTNDTTPPVVSISSPTANSLIKGSVTISISASDNSGISKVELYIDGKLKGTSSSSQFNYLWNTKKVKDGQHTISAIAYDLYGKSTSTTISVQVSNRV